MLLILALVVPATAANGDAPLTARSRVLDGDTISIDLRLLGVDAFERSQLCERGNGCWPRGKAAQDFAARLLRHSDATITLTPMRTYGRPVARVDVNGVDLGQALVGAGLAIPEPRYLGIMPSLARRYAIAYDTARRARRGAHAGHWIEPARWRHGVRLACEIDG